MKTVNEQVMHSFIEHSVYLLQYSEYLSKLAVKELTETEEPLARLVLYYANKLQDVQPGSKQFLKLMVRFEKEVIVLRKAPWSAIGKLLTSELSDVVFDEASYTSRVLHSHLPLLGIKTPIKKELINEFFSTPMDGAILTKHLENMRLKDVDRIMTTVNRNAGTLRQPAVKIMRSVVGTASNKYKDGVTRAAWQGADTLAYTATSSAQSVAKAAVNKTNDFVVKKEFFVATLDSGTTPLCMSLDGKVYKIGEGPHPPLHFRCRSIRIAYLDPESIAERAYDPSTESTLFDEYVKGDKDLAGIKNRSQLPYGYKGDFDNWARARRRELIGVLPDKINYSEFLKQQSVDFQNEKLGLFRAKLFREGNYPLSALVNSSGKFLTKEELKAKGML